MSIREKYPLGLRRIGVGSEVIPMPLNLEKAVNPHFEDFIFDWTYSTYLLIGGY